MREIKFRAWATPVHPYILGMKIMSYFGLLGLDGNYIVGGNSYIGLNGPVMQYTGLRDKNGKEIYEGDILRHEERWVNGESRMSDVRVHLVVVEWFDYIIGGNLASDASSHEVIGNIYENPELTEEAHV